MNETAETADTRSMIELLSHISIDFDSRISFLFNINRFCCTKYILFTHLSFLFAFNETLKYLHPSQPIFIHHDTDTTIEDELKQSRIGVESDIAKIVASIEKLVFAACIY